MVITSLPRIQNLANRLTYGRRILGIEVNKPLITTALSDLFQNTCYPLKKLYYHSEVTDFNLNQDNLFANAAYDFQKLLIDHNVEAIIVGVPPYNSRISKIGSSWISPDDKKNEFLEEIYGEDIQNNWIYPELAETQRILESLISTVQIHQEIFLYDMSSLPDKDHLIMNLNFKYCWDQRQRSDFRMYFHRVCGILQGFLDILREYQCIIPAKNSSHPLALLTKKLHQQQKNITRQCPFIPQHSKDGYHLGMCR